MASPIGNSEAPIGEDAALIDGVRLVGEVRDPLGRTGVAIEQPELGQELVFDPDTGSVLAERTGGTFVRVVEEQGVVAGPRERPRGRPDAPPVPDERAAACTAAAMGEVVSASVASVRCADGVGISVLSGGRTVIAWRQEAQGRWRSVGSARLIAAPRSSATSRRPPPPRSCARDPAPRPSGGAEAGEPAGLGGGQLLGTERSAAGRLAGRL